jgi:hypothetical protein
LLFLGFGAGIEFSASCVLGNPSTTELNSQSLVGFNGLCLIRAVDYEIKPEKSRAPLSQTTLFKDSV